MKTTKATLFLIFTVISASAGAADETLSSMAALRESGVFGFPQKQATVLCDNADLRFSVWNNDEYLFAQAVLWKDNDSSLGTTEDNRSIGDWSEVMLDLDADAKPTPQVDRNYMLNPWPRLGGLHYTICLGKDMTTGILSDSKGRGAIRYMKFEDGQRIRVDTYLIPLTELSRKIGDKIRLCYWGDSPKPLLTVNSAGYEAGQKKYYGYNVPLSKYHDYVLAKGAELDASKVPEGRQDISPSQTRKSEAPVVGEPAPEISAKDWINLKAPLTLKSLRGKVVLVEFWATWCGPCVQNIPHMNELYSRYAGKDLQLLSFVEEGHATMDGFLKKNPVKYPIGLESNSLKDYGVEGIPHAFLVNRGGGVAWEGHPADPEMEKAIASTMEAR